MKLMKKAAAAALAAVMAGTALPTALAYSTPDFTDVPPSHWAYPYVMSMADAGCSRAPVHDLRPGAEGERGYAGYAGRPGDLRR